MRKDALRLYVEHMTEPDELREELQRIPRQRMINLGKQHRQTLGTEVANSPGLAELLIVLIKKPLQHHMSGYYNYFTELLTPLAMDKIARDLHV